MAGKIVLSVLCAIIGYLLGSTTLAILIGDVFYNRDVRNEGSGNMGATNMSRSFGLGPGIITLIWDIGKCAVSLAIGSRILSDTGLCAAGIGCLLGHSFPCFHRFKGGKCVAAGAAVALAISWKVFAAVLAVFAVIVLISRRVSLGSVCAALCLGISVWFFAPSCAKTILGVFTSVLVILRHYENIGRLIKGQEPKFTLNRDN